MKQVLVAMLILCAPIVAPATALAEIKLTGEAKMGLVAESGSSQVATGMRLTAQVSRVTDGGVEFGAVIEMNQSNYTNTPHSRPRNYLYMSTENN